MLELKYNSAKCTNDCKGIQNRRDAQAEMLINFDKLNQDDVADYEDEALFAYQTALQKNDPIALKCKESCLIQKRLKFHNKDCDKAPADFFYEDGCEDANAFAAWFQELEAKRLKNLNEDL